MALMYRPYGEHQAMSQFHGAGGICKGRGDSVAVFPQESVPSCFIIEFFDIPMCLWAWACCTGSGLKFHLA